MLKAKHIVPVIAFVLIASMLVVADNMQTTNGMNEKKGFHAASTFTDHGPITISAAWFGWPGSGTPTDPYRIENLNITSSDIAISIDHTSEHFVISNCFILCTDSANTKQGIDFSYADNGKIENCTIKNYYYAIEARYSDNITIANSTLLARYQGQGGLDGSYLNDYLFQNNTVSGFYYGIFAAHAVGLNTSLNTFKHNLGQCITLFQSTGGFHTNNTIDFSQMGFYSTESSDMVFVNNTVDNCDYGILLESSQGMRTYDNDFGRGVHIIGDEMKYWTTNSFENDYADGRPIAFYNSTNGMDIDASASGTVILANCSGCIVRDGDFSNVTSAILAGFSNHCQFIDNTADQLWISLVSAQHSYWSYIKGNSFTSSNQDGVQLRYSENSVVEGNDFGYALYIIHLDRSRNSTVQGNSYNFGYGGIVSDYTDNCTIRGNSMNRVQYGVRAHHSDNFTIVDNTMGYCSNDAIFLFDCQNFTIIGNTISRSNQYGINIDLNSGNNTIYDNTLDRNTLGNARDDGSDNGWDNGIDTGNAWSDYNGSESVYVVSGSAGSVDHYPRIIAESIPPTITSPGDIQYGVGTTGNTITWVPQDDFPYLYQILRNGTEIESEGWNGSSITINIDGLLEGTYNFTITVWDMSGNSISDTVIVRVTGESATDTTSIVTSTTTATTTGTNTGNTAPPFLNDIVIIIAIMGILVIVVVLVALSKR